ncbi:hypothetical protein BGY98DRAFT_1157527 [Russula aff. rugulosa BPL654]|nr:hypothetical protein BGY98DRAFT_1157527 [Russula aff. rugulosa BPL654]
MSVKRRNRLHFVAKSTLFGKKTFTSWIVEATGAVPIQRHKDLGDSMANNDASMAKLTEVWGLTLEEGGAVCIFPEGVGRYHPSISPLKTGDFILTCSITYIHKDVSGVVQGGSPSRSCSKQGLGWAKSRDQLKDEDIVKLKEDLQAYLSELYQLRIRDDRIRRPLSRPVILYRIVLRFSWASILLFISLGGLALWLPVAITTFYAVHNLKKTGPAQDTWDGIAQTKLFYGLGSGLCVYAAAMAFTLPNFPVAVAIVPVVMWMSLRWFEDAVSAARAFLALGRLLCINPETLSRLRATRSDLHRRVVNLAVDELGLPTDPERHFVVCGEKDKGGVVGRWAKEINYFSVRRRRKRHWDETLRLYEQQFDYPPEDSGS